MNISSGTPNYIFENKIIHYFTLALLLLVSLYGISSAFSRGAANAWYFNGEFSLNNKKEQHAIKDKAIYTKVLTSIKKAQSLDPMHPHYAHMVGRTMHWGIDMEFTDKEKLTEVRQWYLLAAQLRPLWPDPWVDLMRLNNYLDGYNVQTKYYMEQALSVGPNVDLVTLATLQVWLINWSNLSGKERELLFKQFDVATKQNKVLDEVLQFAKDISSENLLCSQLKFNMRYSKQKKSYLYRRYCSK
jgi:hypothetical protein